MTLNRAIQLSRKIQLTAPAILMAAALAQCPQPGANPGVGGSTPNVTQVVVEGKSVQSKKSAEEGLDSQST